jgi:NIPSNAP
MKAVLRNLALAGVVVAGVAAYATHDVQGGKQVNQRVFEMRTYYAHPGKMKALNDRFRDHTMKIFAKHGMTSIGYWNPSDAEEAEKKLIYILAFPSREAAKKSWQEFRADPEWKKVRAESEKDGPIVAKVVSVFMNPTDYSPIK